MDFYKAIPVFDEAMMVQVCEVHVYATTATMSFWLHYFSLHSRTLIHSNPPQTLILTFQTLMSL